MNIWSHLLSFFFSVDYEILQLAVTGFLCWKKIYHFHKHIRDVRYTYAYIHIYTHIYSIYMWYTLQMCIVLRCVHTKPAPAANSHILNLLFYSWMNLRHSTVCKNPVVKKLPYCCYSSQDQQEIPFDSLCCIFINILFYCFP